MHLPLLTRCTSWLLLQVPEIQIIAHVADCLYTLMMGKGLSVSDHLTNLAKLAHILFVCYRQNGTCFLAAHNYANLQSVVKGAFTSVAMAKKAGIGKYFIFQESDDRLEQLFGILRTMAGQNRNMDIMLHCWSLR